jgi:hypothetical protein
MKRLSSGLCFAAFSLFSGYQGTTDYMAGVKCQSWQPTDGKIVSTGTPMDWFRKGANYKPVVTYKYTVNGREYESDRISYPSPHSGGMEEAKAFISKYPINSSVKVYYDPGNPSSASLTNSINGDDLRVSITLFFIMGAIAVFLLWPRKPEKWR